MKVVVIGLGSVGSRHVNNLLSLGIKDIILLRKNGKGNPYGLPEIMDINELSLLNPDLVVLSNPTGYHYEYLTQLIPHNYNILCEKPLVSDQKELDLINNLLISYSGIGKVAFMTRYHPCISMALNLIQEGLIGKILYGKFFIGQYLPDWRPNVDYLETYSANLKQGGGVILDLIHEIDLAEYLLGVLDPNFYSIVGRVGDVTVDSEDIAEIIGKTSSGVICNIHLDYLYRGFKRNILICGKAGNIHCDLSTNKVIVNIDKNESIIKKKYSEFQRNDMFRYMLQDFIDEIKNPLHKSKLPTLKENFNIMNIASSIRKNYYEKK